MKIFVIGSCRNLEEIDRQQEFKQACEALGEAFGHTNNTLIVCSGNEATADPHIIRGLNSVERRHEVIVHRPNRETIREDPDDPVDAYHDENEYENIKFTRRIANGGWRAVHLRALYECDGVIAIGGSRRGTGSVVYSAEVLEKAVVLIPSFEGAAETAWKDFRHYYEQSDIQRLEQPGSDSTWAQQVMYSALGIAKNNPFRQFHKRQTITILLIGLLAVLSWVILFSGYPSQLPKVIIVFFMVALSSVLGTLTRSALRAIGVVQYRWSVNVLLEVFLGLAFAFIIFLLSQVGSFFLNAEAIKLDNLSDIQRVGIGLSVLGLLTALFLEDAWHRISTAGARVTSAD